MACLILSGWMEFPQRSSFSGDHTVSGIVIFSHDGKQRQPFWTHRDAIVLVSFFPGFTPMSHNFVAVVSLNKKHFLIFNGFGELEETCNTAAKFLLKDFFPTLKCMFFC